MLTKFNAPLPTLRSDMMLPTAILLDEAKNLYHFMLTGEPAQKRYLDHHHQVIYFAIENMHQAGWRLSANNLICYIKDIGDLEAAGGESNIRKIFGDLDVDRDVVRRGRSHE